MEINTKFRSINGFTVGNEDGIVVKLLTPCGLEYSNGHDSILLSMDESYDIDMVLTFLVYLPEKIRWRNSGEALLKEGTNQMKQHIRAALRMFGEFTLFIPRDPSEIENVRTRSEEDYYIH